MLFHPHLPGKETKSRVLKVSQLVKGQRAPLLPSSPAHLGTLPPLRVVENLSEIIPGEHLLLLGRTDLWFSSLFKCSGAFRDSL